MQRYPDIAGEPKIRLVVVPLMAALGLPVYINAEMLLPVTAALLEKGMGTGAVVARVTHGMVHQ